MTEAGYSVRANKSAKSQVRLPVNGPLHHVYSLYSYMALSRL
jgi:hypothetical protein